MELSLGLFLEHRTHTRKLEPDLVQEAMQLTLARVGWVCWETRTEMSSATLCTTNQCWCEPNVERKRGWSVTSSTVATLLLRPMASNCAGASVLGEQRCAGCVQNH